MVRWIHHPKTALITSALALLLSGTPVTMATDSDTLLWLPVTLDIPFAEKWFATMELQPRLNKDISRISLLRVRPSLTYRATPHTNLTAGYFWSPDFQTYRDERRLWQQVLYTRPWKRALLNHQFRLEQRFLEGAKSAAWRGRYTLRIIYPIGQSEKWFWVGSNEIMVNLSSNNKVESGFDQNRTFAGIRRKLAANTFIEGGYMLQYTNQPYAGTDQLNHIIQIRLSMNTDDFHNEPAEPPPVFHDPGVD